MWSSFFIDYNYNVLDVNFNVTSHPLYKHMHGSSFSNRWWALPSAMVWCNMDASCILSSSSRWRVSSLQWTSANEIKNDFHWRSVACGWVFIWIFRTKISDAWFFGCSQATYLFISYIFLISSSMTFGSWKPISVMLVIMLVCIHNISSYPLCCRELSKVCAHFEGVSHAWLAWGSWQGWHHRSEAF